MSKATAKVTVVDNELGIIHAGDVVELTAAQEKRMKDLFDIEAKPKRTRTTKKNLTDPPTEDEK